MNFFYRNDIKMTSGKIIAQLCHAAMLPLLSVAEKKDNGIFINAEYARKYMESLIVENMVITPLGSSVFFDIVDSNKKNCHLIFDTGKTVFNGVFTATAFVFVDRDDLLTDVIDYEKMSYSETNVRQVYLINYNKKRDFNAVARDAIIACVQDIITNASPMSEKLFFCKGGEFYSWMMGGFPKIALISKNIDEQIKKIDDEGVISVSVGNKDLMDSVVVISPQNRSVVDNITSGLRLY